MRRSIPFSEVYDAELLAIEDRRRIQSNHPVHPTSSSGGNPSQNGSEQEPPGLNSSDQNHRADSENQIDQDLVGLALSGGGVRSASFNLGLIQALDREGVFSQIDYLSTVSGGGYIGGYVSSLSQCPSNHTERQDSSTAISQNGTPRSNSKTNRNNVQPSEETGFATNFEKNITGLAADAKQPQPKLVRELIYSGDFLRLPLNLLNGYFLGVVLITAFWVSGVAVVGAGLAWLFRAMDGNQARYFLRALGFSDDVGRAFFPSFVLGATWLFAWCLSFLKKGSAANGSVARFILAAFLASILIAVAMLLGTGSIDMGKVLGVLHVPLEETTIGKIQEFLKVAVIVPILLFLIPYFRPSRLLKSGSEKSENWWERAIFKFAGFALLIGVPLLFFGFLAREDISNWNTERPGILAANDVRWNELVRTLETEKETEHQDMQEHNFCCGLWNARGMFQHADELGANPSDKTGANKTDAKKSFDISQGLYDAEVLQRIVSDHFQKDILTIGDFHQKINEIQSEILKIDHELKFYQRWIKLATLVPEAITDEDWKRDNELFRLYTLRRDEYYLKLAALAIVNRQFLLDKQLAEKIAVNLDIKKSKGSTNPENKSANPSERIAKADNAAIRTLVDGAKEFVFGKFDRNSTSSKTIRDEDKKNLLTLVERAKELNDDSLNQLSNINRVALTIYFRSKVLGWENAKDHDLIHPKNKKSLTFVLQKDQQARANIFLAAMVVFLLFGFGVNLNMTSLQGYYRSQIASTWIVPVPGLKHRIPLAQLDTTSRGHPYHLICATANFVRRQEQSKGSTDVFLFSNLYCGSGRAGYRSTPDYCGGSYDLASAVALSGAAVSPIQGRNILLMVLLFIMNLRLGQWLPNPGHKAWWPKWLSRALARWPSPFFVLSSLLRTSEDRAYCFISDGGHFENLGVGALLQRRCKLIVCSDASHDPKCEFNDLADLLRRERVDHGVQIEALDLSIAKFDPLVPEKDAESESYRKSKSQWVIARIKYPEQDSGPDSISPKGANEGYLIYIKPSFANDAELDLETQRRTNPNFPHDPTSDQFYPPEKFEAYRELGFQIGKRLCHVCFENTSVRSWANRLSAQHGTDFEIAKTPFESKDSSAESSFKAEIEKNIKLLSGNEGDAEDCDEAADTLAGILQDRSEISDDHQKRVVQTMISVFENDQQREKLRLQVAAMLSKCPRRYYKLVRKAAIHISDEKKPQNVEIRLAALSLLDVVGLGTGKTYREKIESLRDDKKENEEIRKQAGSILEKEQKRTD